MTTFDGDLEVTEELLEKLPTPGEIRQRLSVHLSAIDLLKRLLKVSERNERVRGKIVGNANSADLSQV